MGQSPRSAPRGGADRRESNCCRGYSCQFRYRTMGSSCRPSLGWPSGYVNGTTAPERGHQLASGCSLTCGSSPVLTVSPAAGPTRSPTPPSQSTGCHGASDYLRPAARRWQCLAAPRQRRDVDRASGPHGRIPRDLNVQAAWAASPSASPVAPIDRAAFPV